MSDSRKISLLDLQAPDLSQYGKTNRDLNRGATRSTDSSYRKQLSESLSKKQTTTSTEKAQERESRSADLKSDQSRTGSKNTESRSTTEPRDDQAPVENQQREGTRSASEKSKIGNSGPEKVTTDQEQDLQGNSETIETTEEVINPQPAANLPTKEKEQTYSLFNTSFAVQNEAAFDQEVTTADSEILPPANFQLVDDQNLVNLQTDVTDTGLSEPIPIPDGLADQLKKQVVETSQTESGQEITAVDVSNLNPELNAANQPDETPTEQIEGEKQLSDAELKLQLEKISDLEISDELKQAIEEYQAKNSDNGAGSTDENEVDIQALIQQRYQRSRNEEQTESDSDEANQGEIPLDHDSLQQVSDTVIEQLQQEPESEQPDITEIVKESSAREAERAKQTDQQNEEVTQTVVNPGLKPASETLSQIQTESTKTAPVSQDNSTIDQDQTLSQSTGTPLSSQTTGTQSTTPVGPPVDVKQVEQLVERIVGAVRQSQSTGQQLKIRLSPPELGTLQIEVSLKNGEYTAKLEVQNRHAQKVINDNIAQLKEALTKTGVSLDRIDVHINTDSTEDQRSSHSDAQTQSGGDFESNQFSENEGGSEERQQEPGFAEETFRQDDVADENSPKVSRSQGIVTENVEEIDVQI
ncbi:Flagellar hook-length control protein FliK [Gimesia alba]|uniref:Flagellar hook-length control protein FliK n=1 Tax=Gimesia alba TaxID=2527973 RepID=A0A517RDY8_9PLAN|nr:flagellar hook-length control protein FliK [Gimesia alba]QDT42092.1 Flagellar hook-length control protein FliK [Gimesia alba]